MSDEKEEAPLKNVTVAEDLPVPEGGNEATVEAVQATVNESEESSEESKMEETSTADEADDGCSADEIKIHEVELEIELSKPEEVRATPVISSAETDEDAPVDVYKTGTDQEETKELDSGGPGSPVNESSEAKGASQEEEEESEAATQKISRELKALLDLSKEAKLDTNLTTKRKTLDSLLKVKESSKDVPTPSPKKTAKPSTFPVTAESELDNLNQSQESVLPEDTTPKVDKKRKASLCDSFTDSPAPATPAKKKYVPKSSSQLVMFKPNKDVFCWRCHHDEVDVACETCPRTYHQRCLRQTITDIDHWPCPECVSILKAENTQTRSNALKGMTLERLCSLLKFAVKRMIQCAGSEPFMHHVDESQFPEYKNYIIQPMNLTMLQNNIRQNLYGSTHAFEADAKWILHNSIIFNSHQSKLTTAAKTIVKVCRQEMSEIENCPSCYLNANTKPHTWFIEVCPKPHLLVWAKLKGFPYWPAKVMSFSQSGNVDVRFFGAHDKAWISAKDCFLYSVRDPNASKQKRNDIQECVKELEVYVSNLRQVYGRVNYASFKTPLDLANEAKMLHQFIPGYKEGGGKRTLREDTLRGVGQIEKRSRSAEVDFSRRLSNENADKNRSMESKNNDTLDDVPKEVTKVRIDYTRQSTGKTRTPLKAPDTPVIGPKRRRLTADHVTDTVAVKSTTDNKKTTESIKSSDEPTETGSNLKADPQNKIKISEHLMKKLTNVEEKKTDNEVEDEKEEEPEVEDEQKSEEDPETKSKDGSDDAEDGDEAESSDVPEKNSKENENISAKDTTEQAKSVVSGAEDQHGAKETKSNSTNTDDDERSNEFKESELDIDVAKIRNIIHSSLTKPGISVPVNKYDGKAARKRRHDNAEEKKAMAHSKPDDISFPPNKMVKLVPIENILQKRIDNESTKEISKGSEQFMVLKEIRVMKDGKEVKNKSEKAPKAAKSHTPIVIKDEMESDDDDTSDIQYMEAKRQLFSVLNLSEKQAMPSVANKFHEIRTRSKTEEKKSKQAMHAIAARIVQRSPSTSSTPPINDNGDAVQTPPSSKKIATVPPSDEDASSSDVTALVKPFSRMQAPKHKARKSFPTPNYAKPKIIHQLNKSASAGFDDNTSNLRVVATSTLPPPLATSTGNVMILPKLQYSKPPTVINNDLGSSSPFIALVPRTISMADGVPKTVDSHSFILQASGCDGVNVGVRASSSGSTTSTTTTRELTTTTTTNGSSLLNSLLITQPPPSSNEALVDAALPTEEQQSRMNKELDNLDMLKEILPEDVSKSISELVCKQPPRLRPRPFNVLSSMTEAPAVIPSSAGPASARINSTAKQLSDFFHEIVEQTIHDLGKTENPLAAISHLKREIEELKYRHNIELTETRHNMMVVLTDVQRSVLEERERLIRESRANRDVEVSRKVDEAKSKQWCANCLKEAQFYCCWNTSYCDYPCQQKHWLKHMNKCTQNVGGQNQSMVPAIRSPGQVVLAPSGSPKFGSLFAKPQKVYLKRANPPYKQTPGGHITLVESTPGNFELVGNGPISVNGKIMASTSVIEKIKSGNIVTVSSPSGGNATELASSANPRVTSTSKSVLKAPAVTFADSER